MPRYRHPVAGDDTPGHPPARVHVSRAEKAAVDADGCFDAPRSVAESIADRHGTTVEAMRVDAEAESGSSAGASGETASGSDADETYTCAGTTAGDEPCTREVDEPGGYCYQHGPED